MTDDARRPGEARIEASDDAERRRALIYAARARGELCAGCGRALAADEPVWIERFVTGLAAPQRRRLSPSHTQAPAGAECASATFRAATEGTEPERCAGCGRGVYYRVADTRRRTPTCSRRCSARAIAARTKEARES